MNSCIDCNYAEWRKTKVGKLHPSGQGQCSCEVNIVLPAAYYFVGMKNPCPCGGYITRGNPLTDCPTWQEKEIK